MTGIDVTPMEPGHFGVQVTEGDTTASARVEVPDAVLDDLALLDVSRERVVEETIGFLLDRQPATALQGEWSLEEIAGRFPDFYDELRARLGQA
jgi:hypothetical protein